MAKEFAKALYKGMPWKICKDGYIKSVGGLCEECLKKGIYVPGEIVHHKIHLTPDNINNPEITLSWDNLQLLCRECHAEKHKRKKRYKIDKDGKVISI